MSLRTSLVRFIVPLTCLALFVPSFAFAVTDASTGLAATGRVTGLSNGCGSTTASACIATLVGRALNVIFGFVGVLLVGYVLYGGFLWMTAAGSKEVGEAREVIVRAIIGLGIIVCSFAISNFVVTQLGQITGGGGGSGSGLNANGTNPSISDIQQGGSLACCYDTSAALENCINACGRTPTNFGLTAGTMTPSLCSSVCQASRICPGTPPTPIAGQTACSRTGLPAPGIGGGVSAYTLDGFCAEQIALLASESPCNSCVRSCLTTTMCPGSGGTNIRARITNQTEARNQLLNCNSICSGPSYGSVCSSR